MGNDDRIVVDVGNPGVRCDFLGNLVDIAHCRQPGTDVEELPDAGLGGQEPHSAEGSPGSPADIGGISQDRQYFQRQLAVGSEIVLPADEEVIDPRRVRHGYVRIHAPLVSAAQPRAPSVTAYITDNCQQTEAGPR